ncbi:MAG: restriction endonuclease subunit S [Fulvivirga sp.]
MPNNWKTYNLGDIAQFSQGIQVSVDDQKREPFSNSVRFIRIVDFSKGDSSEIRYISNPGDRYLVEEDDLVMIRYGSQTAGKIAKGFKGAIANNMFKVVSDKTVLNKNFLYYYLSSNSVREYFNASQASSTMPAITFGMIGSLKIIIPESLPEQRAIASIFSSLDDKIELNLQMNKTLEEMAMTLYKHWFVDFGPFKDGKFIDSELGLIPEGWEVKRLEDFIDLNPRLSLPKGTEASFVEMKALPTNAMSVSIIDRKVFNGGMKFQNGDTLFARITPCLENGKTAFVDFLFDNEIAFGSTEFLVMRAKHGVSKYWTYCLSRDYNFRKFSISTMVGTSGRQRVQNGPFLSFEIAKPPKTVFDLFTEQVEHWFTQIRHNTIENQTLTNLRDTLLPKLISGEVRVKEAEQTVAEVL